MSHTTQSRSVAFGEFRGLVDEPELDAWAAGAPLDVEELPADGRVVRPRTAP